MSLIDELLGQPDLEEEIWQMHMLGLAPSQIAAKLPVSEEKAHDVVVERWKLDKERNADRRSSRG